MTAPNITITDELSVEDFLYLRKAVGFQELTTEQGEIAMKNSAYICAAYIDGNIAGATRLLFDFCKDAYLTDVMVDPRYQKMGVGKAMVQANIDFMKNNATNAKILSCVIYANPGKEPFYEKLGFEKIPAGKYGYGMVLEITKTEEYVDEKTQK